MSRKFFFLFVVASLLLATAGSASVNAGQIKLPDREPPPQNSSVEQEWGLPGFSARPMKAPGVPHSLQSGLAPAVDLGQPGLSFAYKKTFGVTEEPYLPDTIHLNEPGGLFIDLSNNVYVVEREGSRLLRYTSAGVYNLSIGRAGMHMTAQDNFSWPNDAAVDSDGNIWVVDNLRAVQFNSSGNYIQAFPPEDTEDWIEDNDHMATPYGIAFDSSGRMYVSDMDFQRVQVFSFNLSGTPVYSTTIGTAFVQGNDNLHFNYPARIAIDSLNRLYVVDSENHRVQRCTYAPGWTCGTFHGTGVGGSGDNQLSYPQGIAIDGLNNVYIVDTDNKRVKKCTPAGVCSTLVSHMEGFANDVAVDTLGNLYVSIAIGAHQVIKFDSLGNDVGALVGVNQVPYVTDTTRLNNPAGLAVDSSGNIYVSENRGHRLVKMNPNGVQLWTIGEPGIFQNDDIHLGHPDGNLAIDLSGRVYISNTNQHHVNIYNSDKSYYNALGVLGEPSNDNAHFNRPNGVAISPLNGDIYVADRDNQRVQVFYSNLQWKATLGVTGVKDKDNAHFNQPYGVAVDWNGNIYVADRENHRVQKFNSSYAYVDTLGVTGQCSNRLDHLCRPSSVAVDRLGRVYVSVSNRNRVEVFDANGGYLTTIGGTWGTQTGALRNSGGVAVDRTGAVYVADRENHRVQKYSPAILGWTQRNLNGFGERENSYVATLAGFQNQLYAGTYNVNGGQLWRSSNGLSWSAVRKDGLGNLTNIIVDDLIEFGGKLYAGTGNEGGAQIWRSDNGTNWSEVTPPGLDPDTIEFMLLEVFENKLYANASGTESHGTEIWRCTLCDGSDWSKVVTNGLGDVDNTIVTSFTEYNGYLYAGLWNTTDGAEVWRSETGDSGSWARVASGGFGDVYNTVIGGMAVFGNKLYAGTANYTNSNNPGAELWRCQDCDGSPGDWEVVPISKGFGDTENRTIYLVAFQNDLLALTTNRTTGTQAWSSSDGTNWRQVNLDGFGSSNNSAPYWENSIEIFNDRLFVGLVNFINGGQIWMYLPVRIYLPLTMK